VKAIDFDRYLEEQLKRPAFREAYDELEEEYELAKQIIRFRLGRNLTQAQLAKLAGTSQPAIARLESGNHRNLTLGFLAKVARALEMRPEMKFRPLRQRRALRITSSVSTSTRRARKQVTAKR
jgi:transcriptional regulator with XRE-family HTH domain